MSQGKTRWTEFDERVFSELDPNWCTCDSNLSVLVLSVLWLIVDVCVCVKADSHTMNYFTNQVWVYGLAIRFLLVFFELFKSLNVNERVVRILAAQWYVLGAAQCGVMFTFWLLIGIDTGTIDDLVNRRNYAFNAVMLWNHARHVFPVIVHAVITVEKRVWLTRMACTRDSFKTTRVTYLSTMLVPLTAGAMHLAFFDDKEIYAYNSENTTTWCAICFTFSSLVSAKFLLHLGNSAGCSDTKYEAVSGTHSDLDNYGETPENTMRDLILKK